MSRSVALSVPTQAAASYCGSIVGGVPPYVTVSLDAVTVISFLSTVSVPDTKEKE